MAAQAIHKHSHLPKSPPGSRGRTPGHIPSCGRAQARRTAGWSRGSAGGHSRSPLETTAQNQNQSTSTRSHPTRQQTARSASGGEKKRDNTWQINTINHKRFYVTLIWLHVHVLALLIQLWCTAMYWNVQCASYCEAFDPSDGWKISFRKKSHWWRLMSTDVRCGRRIKISQLEDEISTWIAEHRVNGEYITSQKSNQANYEWWSHSWQEIWMREWESKAS